MNKNSIKQKLIVAILILIVLIILSNVLKNLDRTNSVENYKSETYVEDFIAKSRKIKDRDVYYILENIISEYISSYNPQATYGDEITYKDYYKTLTKKYTKYLSYNKYLAVSEEFLQDFYITQNVSNNFELVFRELLREIYVKDNNKYMCVVRSNNMEVDKYIGIQLNYNDKTFNIFYIK